jgi:hypothetical protein
MTAKDVRNRVTVTSSIGRAPLATIQNFIGESRNSRETGS